MKIAKRIPFYTKCVMRNEAKIPMPPPKTIGLAHPVIGAPNCFFWNLNENASNFKPLIPPPIIIRNNSKTRIVEPEELKEMRRLRREFPTEYTISHLKSKFNINKSFIINNVIPKEDRLKAENHLDESIDLKNLNKKRGDLMRHKIIEHRRRIW